MSTKQSIAVIGAAGNMGSAIARSLSAGNNRLLLLGNHKEKVDTLVNSIRQQNVSADVESLDCPTTAAWEADIIILAVPYQAEKELAAKLKDVTNTKIVISISNPLNESYDGLVTDPSTSAAEQLQQLLPNAKVVKAFNTTFAADFASPIIDGRQVDSLIAGNDPAALRTVADLVGNAGFNPVIAGNLAVSQTLERMALLMIQLTMKYNYNWLAGWKILHN